MITIESFPDLKNIKILIDVCNICYYQKTDDGKPILANLMSVLHRLIKELEIPRHNIICISDPGVVRYMDDSKKFQKMIDSGEVIKSPKTADEFILGFALSCDFCLIITNDKYRDYIKQLPSEEWLQDRSVNFMIINGVTVLSPNIDLEKLSGRVRKTFTEKISENTGEFISITKLEKITLSETDV